MNPKKRSVLLYGRTRSGKTTQIGQLAEKVFLLTGLRTRLYTTDRGGFGPIQPYIDLGIIEVIPQLDTDPWIFLNKAVRGFVRDSAGKWVPGAPENLGVVAFESMTSHADNLMNDLAKKAAMGVNIGGAANISFTVSGDGESAKVGGANQAHYQVVQGRITEEVWESQKLPVGSYVMWTASVSKDDDTTASGKVLGPQVVGKALTSEVPRWFNLTFRIDALPAQNGKPERHILYLGNHMDVNAGNAVGLGNTRIPLDAPALAAHTIEPASISKALDLIDGGYDVALETIRKRLGSKL